jgi:hypothetical protein
LLQELKELADLCAIISIAILPPPAKGVDCDFEDSVKDFALPTLILDKAIDKKLRACFENGFI